MGVICSLIPFYLILYLIISLIDIHSCYIITNNKLITIKKKGYFRSTYVINDYLFSDLHSLKFNKIDAFGNLYFCVDKECHPKLNQKNNFKHDEMEDHNFISIKGVYDVEKVQNFLEKLITSFWKDTPIREDHHLNEIIIQNENDEEKVNILTEPNELIGE